MIMYWIIGLLVIIILVLSFVIFLKNNKIIAQSQSYENQLSDIKKGLSTLQDYLVRKHGRNWLCVLCDAPDGDYIGEDGLPHSSPFPIADNYTFFFGGVPTSSTAHYHHRNCRYCKTDLSVNAYTIQHRRMYIPCAVCSPDKKLPDIKWVEKYYGITNKLNKYIVISKDPYKCINDTDSETSSRPTVYISWRD